MTTLKLWSLRQSIFVILLWCLAVSAGGCQSSDQVTLSQLDHPTEISSADLARAYNQRIASVTQFHARGVLEIRWEDEDGHHLEQGNIDLWVERPENVSLRVAKLGEIYLWAGQNQQTAWVFDMTGPDTTLAIHDRGEKNLKTAPSMSLLALLGLVSLGDQVDETTEASSAITQTAQGLWEMSMSDGRGTQQWLIEPSSYEPRRMRVLDVGGQELARVDFDPSVFTPLLMPGTSILATPKIPGRVRLFLATPNRTDKRTFEPARITLRLVNPDADVQEEPMDRVFDLERLTQALRPGKINRGQQNSWLGGGLLDVSGATSSHRLPREPESEVPLR